MSVLVRVPAYVGAGGGHERLKAIIAFVVAVKRTLYQRKVDVDMLADNFASLSTPTTLPLVIVQANQHVQIS